jgi:putrescine transport system substrate-binding protein
MHFGKPIMVAMMGVTACLIIGCGSHDSGAKTDLSSANNHNDRGVVNLYIWANYLPPDTIPSFEKDTGVKVHVAYYDTNETLEGRILTGNSGFDVVVPSDRFIQRQIRSGAYLTLDKTRLPNLANLDPAILARVTPNDPGNAHGVVDQWGTFGIGYNEKVVKEVLPNVPLNSWRLIFDPIFASKLARCGITIIDAPAGVVRLVLKYLGKNPNAPSPQDLADVASVLVRIRPYIRNIESSNYREAIANGDICIALGYNGDFVEARNQAKEAKNGINVRYVIPNEGSVLWFDLLAIPRDAPNVENAYRFINYVMDAHVSANISSTVAYATANLAALPLIAPSITEDTAIYPTSAERDRLFVESDETPEQLRTITRLWQKFKTGQ